jgi:xeroderma pigmentosum group C-complementing protein
MAVPVIQGVVIAEENHDMVMVELEKDEAERARKEDEKRRKKALAQWRRFLMGMRIAERIRQEYGEITDDISVFGHARDSAHPKKPALVQDEDMAGGFLPDGYEEEEEEEQEAPAHHTSSFFPAVDEDDDGDDGLVMEHDGVDQQRMMVQMDIDGEEEAPQRSQAEAGLDPEPNAKLESETDQHMKQEASPEQEEPKLETQSEAESEQPRTSARSRKRAPEKRTKKEQQPPARATRRSTRSGRKVVSYDEDVVYNDGEIGDSYAESEDEV